MTDDSNSHYLGEVRRYYDRVTPLYLRYMGDTYQAGLIRAGSEAAPYRATNLFCASRAGIQPGHRVLDAGCGTGGPAIDIAQSIAGVTIDAITLSPVQAHRANELVRQAGLADRIRVYLGDFHRLPFDEGAFDTALFLESMGYSYDPDQLLAEVCRVLRPGGTLYVKGIFQREPLLSEQERAGLAEFDQVYAHKTPRMSTTVQRVSALGFRRVESDDLTEMLSTEAFAGAMVTVRDGVPALTELGQLHRSCLPAGHGDRPVYCFGEIKARKPG